jgi:hypothetical protein
VTLRVYVTDGCQADADRHGQGSILKNVRESVERSQNLTGFNFFLPTPFVKKNLGRSFRLIAYTVPIFDNELVLLLRVLARGSKEYESFLAKWDKDTVSITRQFQPYDNAQLQEIYGPLMEWSGRAPAPPASYAGKGRQRQGARYVFETQHRNHRSWH